jgi:hypothetical protein
MSPGGGCVKELVVFGRVAEVYHIEGEGLFAYVADLPYLEVRGDTIADLIYKLEVAISVENELDRLWESEGIIEQEEEDEQ